MQRVVQYKPKTLLKEIKENITKCKYVFCSDTGKLNFVKKSTLLKVIQKLDIGPIKSPIFFSKSRTTHLKIHMKY